MRRHADTVSGAADQVAQARAAAGEVMGAEAYGQLCQFLPGLLNPVFESAAGLLGETAAALRETSLKLRTTADEAEAADADSAGRVSAAGGPALELPL
ncbi:MAG: hypothetical protein ABW022_25810 [Actinoplanes sp.]